MKKRDRLALFLRRKIDAALDERISGMVLCNNTNDAQVLAKNAIHLREMVISKIITDTYSMMHLQDIMDHKFRKADQ